MFEKEAEEYVSKIRHDVINWDGAKPEERFYNEIKFKQAYLAGAELGYNKANEWHKQEVDDIYDLISEDWSVRYFICIMKDKSRVTAIGNCDEGCNGEVSVNLFFEHDDEKYYIDDIVWWKEIVPPKDGEK